MPQMRRKQFIWKTAKALMCFCTTGHVSPVYNKTDITMEELHFNRQCQCPRGLYKLLEGTVCSNYPVCDFSVQCAISGEYAAQILELRHHLQLFPTHHDDWLCILSCSIPTNYKHFCLLCAYRETQRRNVASMTLTASLSFSAVSQISGMSSAYSRIHISSSVGFLQCLSWPSILKHMQLSSTDH